MKRSIVLFSLLLSAVGVPPMALAQDAPAPAAPAADPTVTTWTKEKIEDPPKREIKYERIEQPLERDFQLSTSDAENLIRVGARAQSPFQGDVNSEAEQKRRQRAGALRAAMQKLPEQEFVALIRLSAPAPYWSGYWLRNLNIQNEEILLLHRFGPEQNPLIRATYVESLADHIKQIPINRLPSADELAFFASPAVDAGYLAKGPGPKESTWEVRIFAPTADEAEQRARTLLTILDYGRSRPIQLIALKEHERLSATLGEQQRKLKAAEAEIAAIDSGLERYADYQPDMLPALRLQQMQLDVDIAGVKARLDAIKAQTEPNLRPTITSLLLTAEIELIGFEARRKKSNELITNVRKKSELNDKRRTIIDKLNTALRDSGFTRKAMERYVTLLDTFSPPPLVDGKVIIQPVDWKR